MKKLVLMAVVALAFASCGGNSPADKAKKVCDCGDEFVQLMKDNKPEADLKAKNDECEKMYEGFKAEYKDDSTKLKEFNSAFENCSKEITKKVDEAQSNYNGGK